MGASLRYRIVKMANGAHSVHSVEHAETFHPVVGPVAEAEALYVRQVELCERLKREPGELVIWDIGLGAAANAVTVLRAAEKVPCRIHLVSFDHTLEPLEFALRHVDHLEYLRGYEEPLRDLLAQHRATLSEGPRTVKWEVHLADFPSFVARAESRALAKPHVIMFDAFSPAKNPAMWTQRVFADVFGHLDPGRPCMLPTYSRSTMLRVTLLLAGFYVGVGHATGEKEETTVAANTLAFIREPLDRRWLERAQRSTSAEPLWEPVYRQAPLTGQTWERLKQHAQFS